jgi:lipid-A-disaccharide synthase-like uncharacterized protein
MDTVTLIGTSGATIILIAFFLNQLELWKSNDLIYDTTNFIGGAILVYFAWKTNSLPFLILNGVWTLVSLRDIFLDTKDLQSKRNTFKWIHHRKK